MVISRRLLGPLVFLVTLAAAAALVFQIAHPPTGAPTAQAQAASRPVYRVATTQQAVAIGINVVWGTEYVPRILKILETEHAHATFFVGGAWAAANPGLVREMLRAGMELGNHGYAHRHQSTMNFDENVAEITKASHAIEAAGAPRPTLFAPPYGEYDATVLQAASALHMTLVMWTIDTIDWRPSSSPALITSRVLNRAAAGSIILMHPTDRTVEALPDILRQLHTRGYQFLTTSQLLATGTPEGE